jgi:type I restriction enzyme, S subunit
VSSVLKSTLAKSPWSSIGLGRIVDRSKEAGRVDLQSLSVFLDQGVVPRSTRDDNHNQLGADLEKYLVVQPGDVVFNKLRTWQGGFGVSKYEGTVSPAYFVCRPHRGIEGRYLHYLLHSSPYLAELTRLSKFMPPSQFDIAWDDLKQLPIALPPLAFQQAIADYLDGETARIDSLIEKKRRMVELLEERESSLIEGQLHGHGKVDSDSQCPQVHLRWCMRRIVDGTHGSYERVDEGMPLLSAKNLVNGSVHMTTDESLISEEDYLSIVRSRRFSSGDVLMGVIGGSIGNVARLREGDPLAFQRSVACLSTGPTYLADFLYIVAKSSEFQGQLTNLANESAQAGVYLDQIGSLRVPLPSLSVQHQIVEMVNHETRVIVRTSEEQLRAMSLLGERRESIISAAVVGEVPIPGVGA